MELSLFVGGKSIPLRDLSPEAWHYLVGSSTRHAGIADLYRAVPWLFRGVVLRAQTIATLPFAIWRGEEKIDDSSNWRNAVGFLSDPVRLLWHIEASLTLTGCAYLFRERNRMRTLQLRPLSPLSVHPVLDVEHGLTGFTRVIAGTSNPLAVEDVIYFWLPDPFVEIGPPTSSPAQSALSAARVLFNLDEFVAKFFERGAIKATLLTVEGNPPLAEREKLKSWWQRLFDGIRNAWQTEVVSAAVKPVIVGEGIQELENETISNAKREAIATALGIPHSVLFSNAANYAVSQEDNLHFYSKTIVPEAQFIAGVLNTQVFQPLGLTFRFAPETLDVFQEDENQRATALVNLTSAGVPLGMALQILGFELPEPYTYNDLNASTVVEDSATDSAAMRADLQRWQRKALSRHKQQRKLPTDFVSAAIPAARRAAIGGALESAQDADDIRSVFRDVLNWVGYP